MRYQNFVDVHFPTSILLIIPLLHLGNSFVCPPGTRALCCLSNPFTNPNGNKVYQHCRLCKKFYFSSLSPPSIPPFSFHECFTNHYTTCMSAIKIFHKVCLLIRNQNHSPLGLEYYNKPECRDTAGQICCEEPFVSLPVNPMPRSSFPSPLNIISASPQPRESSYPLKANKPSPSRILPWGSARQLKNPICARLIIRLDHPRMARRAMLLARGMTPILTIMAVIVVVVVVVVVGGGPQYRDHGKNCLPVYGN